MKLARRLRRKYYESRDKELIRLERELLDLYGIRRELPLIKLDQPIHRGYKKFFVLRDDVARRRDAHVFETILKEINTTIYSRTIDFKSKKYHNRQRSEQPHELAHIPKHKWAILGWPSYYKKWFYYRAKQVARPYYGYGYYEGYWFGRTWMFDTKIEPYYITHTRQIDPDLESKIKKLKDQLYSSPARHRLANLHGGYGRDDYEIESKSHKYVIGIRATEFQLSDLDEQGII